MSKRTIAEARNLRDEIIGVVLAAFGQNRKGATVEKYSTGVWGWVLRKPLRDDWYLEFTAFFRVRGDEKEFGWEPDEDETASGDGVRVELNCARPRHKCPDCECGWEGSAQSEFSDADAARKWSTKLAGKFSRAACYR